MADREKVPLGAAAPPLTCGRVVGPPGFRPWRTSQYCGSPADFHVIWEERDDGAVEGGLACAPHMEEIRRTWRFLSAHPYDPLCSFPGAAFDRNTNRCVVDETEWGFEEGETT